jgi:Tti2 family
MCHLRFSIAPGYPSSFSLCDFVFFWTCTLSDRMQSLNRALTFLHSPHTPAILRTAIPSATNLIEHTTEPGSEQRFNQLCALLGDGVIGSVWMYSSDDPDAVEASIEVLPILVRALGIGATRYLKVRFQHSDRPAWRMTRCQALIPQLMHPLHAVPFKKPRVTLQLSSLRALGTVIQECSPRIENWRSTILEGVAKCWVVLLGEEQTDEGTVQF